MLVRSARKTAPNSSPTRGLLHSPAFWVIVLAAVLAPSLLLAECVWLRARQQAQAVAWANDKIEEKIALARALMAEQNWNEAIHQLEDALIIDQATNQEKARALLQQAQRGQAETLLKSAENALVRRDTDNAFRWLQAYLAHPQTHQTERARMLLADLEHSLSDDEAAQFLMKLSDGDLIVFQREGQLPANDGLHSAAAREIYQQTLRRHLPNELKKRQAQRESERVARQLRAAEHARRLARLRETSAFQALTAFVAQTLAQASDQQQTARQQEAELAVLFKELKIKDATEQAKIRADLTSREDRAASREAIERKRGEIKRQYRNSPAYDPADQSLFDELVDEEVERLLKALVWG